MNTTRTNAGENLLTLTTQQAPPDPNESIFRFNRMDRGNLTGESVNNYFKSMKEIEAEFLSSMHSAKTTLKNMLSDLSQFGHNLIYLDGDLNFPDPDDISQGYMEENY